MKQSKTDPPAIYAIWAEARLDGPLQGRSGFLSEDGYRLFFTSDTEMDQKIQDLRGLCLNRTPAVTYHGVAYPGDHDISAGISVEQIKACDLRPDFDSTRYEITQRIYGNTGGGCMVGTLAVRYPELEKTLWIHCNDEGVSVSSADYVWNEDHSGSWARYEDVSIMEIDFWEQSPEDAGALFPAIQDTVTYTIQQAVQNSNRPFRIPAKWLPEAFCQTTDSEYIKWAVEVEHAVEVGKEGVIINDPMYLKRNAPQMIAPGTIAYIASPLSGNKDENLQFARKACGYAAARGQSHTPLICCSPSSSMTTTLNSGTPASAWACRCSDGAMSCGSVGTSSAMEWQKKKNWRAGLASPCARSVPRRSSPWRTFQTKGWRCPWDDHDYGEPV